MFYAVLLFVFLADQLTKFFALQTLAGVDSVPVISGIFYFTLVHNTGVAFGFFRQHPQLLLGLISLSLCFLLVWGIRVPPQQKTQRFALALILGGALGNWVDRLRYGAVIDFLDFRVWPVFNVADSAITVGVTLFAWHLLRQKKS